jgi:hypothetical protein
MYPLTGKDRDEKIKRLALVYNHGSQNHHLTLILCWFFMKTAGSLMFLK